MLQKLEIHGIHILVDDKLRHMSPKKLAVWIVTFRA